MPHAKGLRPEANCSNSGRKENRRSSGGMELGEPADALLPVPRLGGGGESHHVSSEESFSDLLEKN